MLFSYLYILRCSLLKGCWVALKASRHVSWGHRNKTNTRHFDDEHLIEREHAYYHFPFSWPAWGNIWDRTRKSWNRVFHSQTKLTMCASLGYECFLRDSFQIVPVDATRFQTQPFDGFHVLGLPGLLEILRRSRRFHTGTITQPSLSDWVHRHSRRLLIGPIWTFIQIRRIWVLI